MSYPIIICEDQITQLNQLETIIQNYILFHSDLFEIKLKTQSPVEVEKYLKTFKPSQGIYFLDIDLNHTIDGIDLAEKIRESDVQAKIIFTTTHEEMLPLTIKRRVETLGFVTKDQPLDDYRAEIVELLTLAQQRIDAVRTNAHQAFIFSIGSQQFVVNLHDVYFIEPSELPHRVRLYTKNGHYEFYGKLSELEKQYPSLIRINRSCLANPLNMQEINFKTREIHFEADLVRVFSIGKAAKIKERLKQPLN
ncbi:response regulator transcription factor [Vagococcus acidifermentans]|uniref:DNA-binding response regulator n=1 Tax=Vagococcus acidifermentans TaxID=564710 RepID=A0A430AWU1_9ENTE|nr:response regulator transcription factor [Vagococcus acidifermentans]RSU12524.1 DNA-binding response regulator [Vagococcus acidifermentans]